MKECVIYKYVYHDDIIYIGKSDSSLIGRIRGHEKENKFKPYLSDSQIYYFTCLNPAETTIYETFLINKYKPVLNVAMKYTHSLTMTISEPKWTIFKSQEFDYIEANRLKYKRPSSRVRMEYFALLDELISRKIIRESRSLYYEETLPFSEEITISDIEGVNRAFELLKTGQKQLIVAAKIEENYDLNIVINTSLIKRDFFFKYKKLIGKAIIEYC